MQPDDLIPVLDSVFGGVDGHAYHSTTLRIAAPNLIKSSEEIETLVEGLKSHVGWIARQSGVEVWGNHERDDATGLGEILAAELGNEDHTVQIRRQPGAWVVTEYHEGTGTAHVAEDISHITVRHGTLRYRRYWSLPEDGASEPIAARLIRIEGVSK